MAPQAKIIVVGATGLLGSQIVSGLLDRGEAVRALVRPGLTGEKKDAISALQARGLEVVEGDITDPVDRLAERLDGIETVISAVQGGPETIEDGQVNLLRAAEKAGATRFIPSDFAIDIFKLDIGDNFMIDMRKRAAQRFEGTSLKVISVLNGAFLEVMTTFMQIVDWEKNTFSHWGDPDQPQDLTTVKDTAAYTVAAALDASLPAGPLRFAGDVVSMRQFHAAVERATGRKLEFKTLGTADELRAEIERRAAKTENPFEYVALQYQWGMVNGKAKFDTLDNARYPEVKPTSTEEFVRATAPSA
ncbi:NmrA family NAD(P)-binding protein [Streptomyces sp. NPDC041068]|uniref:NmrA family NAD(P)-binding protein n=1 Tax=Streptomyces sp. NPDC041068 TaxID=3155130 RepID=UPI0033DBCA9D